MNLVNHIISQIKFKGNFFIIGIDGPTASGKTTLATALASKLNKKNIHCITYQLDWTLSERNNRLKQVEKILANEKNAFEYESFFHMKLEKAKEFLEDVALLRFEKNDFKEICINDLYNREDGGLCNGTKRFLLKKNTVIIVEGHYTHHQSLRSYFDINYMLKAQVHELLRRKKERVGKYRDEKTTEKYFNQIDLPSFKHYYFQNKAFIKNIYKNESFDNQEKITQKKFEKIFETRPIEVVKPSVLLVPVIIKGYMGARLKIDLFLKALSFLHKEIINLRGVHPAYRSPSISKYIGDFLESRNANLYYLSTDTDNKDFLHYEFGFKFLNMLWLVSATEFCLNLTIANDYTLRCLTQKFNIDGRVAGDNFTFIQSITYKNKIIVAPNKFFIPEKFDTSIATTFMYKKDNYFTNYLNNILTNRSFVVLRFCDSSQYNFYKELFNKSGFLVFRSLKYLFATNYICDKELNIFKDLEAKYAQLVDTDKHELGKDESAQKRFIGAGIRKIDGTYFLPDNFDIFKLRDIYTKASLRVRNEISKGLLVQYPDLCIKQRINISEYFKNLPVVLNELYFALSFSKKGAVPFLTVYPTESNHIDIETYFDFFSEKQKPFGIQASMNALGTKGKDNTGYLLINGPFAFSEKVRTNLFNYIRKHKGKSLPLWGLGVDHAAGSLQFNTQVVKFIEEAVLSDCFTSFCIDGSAFITYEADEISIAKMKYFLEQIKVKFININAEIEFYIGNENIFLKLNDDRALDIYHQFSKLFHRFFAEKRRDYFYLLGPFLGTLHHRMHKELKQNLSCSIFEKCLQNNFIGNVLHGTSLTSFSDINQFARNHCIRVNFAGKFLQALIEALPSGIKKQMGNNQEEQKHKLPLLNKEIINKSADVITKYLKEVLVEVEKNTFFENMDEDEVSWFRDNYVCFSVTDFTIILNKIQDKIKTKTSNKPVQKQTIFLASMIEVPFGLFKNKLAKRLVHAGVNHFHIDFGDGDFITRKLDGLERLKYLCEAFPNVHIHLHLMVRNPFDKIKGVSLIEQIGAIKRVLIYIHAETYNMFADWETAVQFIKQNDCIPGLVIKLEEGKNLMGILKMVQQYDIHNILMMGVPLGRGGQSFNTDVIKHIEKAKKWAVKNKYELFIEVDGGLSDHNINDCICAGANYLSGWSMFLKYGTKGLEKRIKELIHE